MKGESFFIEIITKTLRFLSGIALAFLLIKLFAPIIGNSPFMDLAIKGISIAGFYKPISSMKWQQGIIVLITILGILGIIKLIEIIKQSYGK